jgi:cell division transport system permease protein
VTVLAAQRYAVGRAFAMIRDRPGAFLFGALLAASALALPLTLASLLWSARPVLVPLQPTPEFSVFVSPRASPQDIEGLRRRLGAQPGVVDVQLQPKEAALAQLIKRSGFGSGAIDLPTNPLPDVLIARLAGSVSAEAIETLAGTVKTWPSVEAVRSDLDWYRKIQAIGRVAVTGLAVFGGLAVAVVALILVGTVRLHAGTRADEVAVLRLVGATPRFVIRPYAYSAALTLGVAALLAAAAVKAAHVALCSPLEALTTLYGHPFSLPPPEPGHVLAVFLIAVVFGWLIGAIGARATAIAGWR